MTSLVASGLCGPACDPPDSEEFFPSASTQPFAARAIQPAPGSNDVPRDAAVVLQFSDFPNPPTLAYPAVSIGPRGDPARVVLDVSLVDRQLHIRPIVPFAGRTEIVLTLSPRVQSLAGQPLAQTYQLVFRTGLTLAAPMVPEPAPQLRQLVAPGGALAGRCTQGGCHNRMSADGQPGWEPAAGLDLALDPISLRSQLLAARRGGIEGLLLIEPGRPQSSYFLRKLLAAQPDAFCRIVGSPMPLAGPPLPLDALRTIETWIRTGAQ